MTTNVWLRRAMNLLRKSFSGTAKASASRLADQVDLLHDSSLVDAIWYRQTYPDLRNTPIDVARHYLEYGASEGRNPSSLFHTSYYLYQNPDVAASGMNPLVHYLLYGAQEARSPLPPRSHTESRLATPSLLPAAPIAPPEPNVVLPDENSETDPASELRRQIDESGLFDASWYLKMNGDVARTNSDPLDHFINFGSAECRSPGPNFDARWYIEEYPDVCSSGMSPLVHYLLVGCERGYQPSGSAYERWCTRFDTLTDDDRQLILINSARNILPNLLIIAYFDCATSRSPRNEVAAISGQLYKNWRAILIFERGYDQREVDSAREWAKSDSRFRVVSGQEGLGDLPRYSSETCIVLLPAGIIMREHALYMLATAATSPEIRVVYSDEDMLDGRGRRTQPVFKPRYSPELARTTHYLGPVVLIRGVEQSGEHVAVDLLNGLTTFETLLGCILPDAHARSVSHIPSVLYHDTTAPRLRWTRCAGMPVVDEPLATFSILIPTRDRRELLEPCISSIEQRTDYPRSKLEIIVIDNGSTDPATVEYLDSLAQEGRARIIRDDGEFNFSRLNNVAAAVASHRVLLFVNNDTIVDDPLWLQRIVAYVVQKDVGTVGGKLLYPDRTIQHGGVILGIQGVAGHDLVGLQERDPNARLDVTREVSAVTGACLAVRREIFERIGGFDTTLAVAFNDTLFCLEAMKAGYRNIYISDALLIHFESKSRGYDLDPERVALFQREARYARQRHNEIFKDDPYYNPNLCLQRPNELAFPPRRTKPWRQGARDLTRLRVLMLSSTTEIGHGVAVVIDQQAAYLAAAGHEVYIGGPKGKSEFQFAGCRRIYLEEPAAAAAFAVEHGIDCVVAHTPPFFSVARWLGEWPPTLFLDYGEPPPDHFPDRDTRRSVAAEKQLCFSMASKVCAISDSVRAEGTEERALVIPLANSHLAIWSENMRPRRNAARRLRGWEESVVILNVCRFGPGERHYKGIDKYREIMREFRFARPELAARTIFVLCGKADREDVDAMREFGLEVFANVTDAELIELYLAADIYANFSRWEGYNLGIGQALAMGLPVIASEISAHRAFPIFTSNDTLPIVGQLSQYVEYAARHPSAERRPIVVDWHDCMVRFEREIVELCRATGL